MTSGVVRLTDDTVRHIIYVKGEAEKLFFEELSINEAVHSVFMFLESEVNKGVDIKKYFAREKHSVTKLQSR
jgi:hypothetical protein